MRLSNIKLSGFKSFVDPTTLKIPGNLVGIVGPNGCGKSNIIDALIWVMGESSARHLRGNALTDIIFNGAGQRKSVGQATVELIFDNTDKKLGGQYASYNEISIKRQINREGVSSYYLNGGRCRRRDITGIFLGTGLGPRSYAVIEQGMIARLIEARPDELRAFLEEAAGISKYRERRRETQNRIEHTNDNINRINDVIAEIKKQISYLKRQAKVAERYQLLKQQERTFKAEQLALGWRDLESESDRKKAFLMEHENRMEAARASLRSVEADVEKHRNELTQANTHFNHCQSGYYSISGDISQLEQNIQHTHERQTSLSADLEQARTDLQQTRAQYEHDKRQLQALDKELAELEPELQSAELKSDDAQKLLNEAESIMQGWQTEWDTFNQTRADLERQCQLDQTRLEHLEHSIDDIISRRTQLEDELHTIEARDPGRQTRQLRENFDQKQSELAQLRTKQADAIEEMQRGRKESAIISNRLDETRSEQQLLKGQLASLEALQQDDPGYNDRRPDDWLRQNNINNIGHLAKQLEVEPEWIKALEMVTGGHLQSLYIEDLAALLNRIDDGVPDINVVAPGGRPDRHPRWTRLIEKINNDLSLPSPLESVFIAADWATALAMRNELEAYESIVTADGVWMGVNWLVIHREAQNDAGTLLREQNITGLRERLQRADERVTALTKELDESNKLPEQAEQKRDQTQQRIHDLQSEIAELSGSIATNETQSRQNLMRTDRIAAELEQLSERQQDAHDNRHEIKRHLSNLADDQQKLHHRHEELVALREKYQDSLDTARPRWRNAREQSHRIELRIESLRSRRDLSDQAIKRNNSQLSQLDGRCNALETDLAQCREPLNRLQSDLKQKLEEKISVDQGLTQARAEVQTVETNLRERERMQVQYQQNTRELQSSVEQARLDVNESGVRLQTVEEQLEETGRNLTELLGQLEEDAKSSDWRDKLAEVTRKIEKLGPVNLAAMDEFNQLTERKTYLDGQLADLNDALTTLENVIHKIDRETRTRFKETFDGLNHHLETMFPQLFGGGRAYLELTGSDWLETGVTIMARPPGKRNSTIQLLSGGEKALTAVALVFSIFKLNPAPFCILDEVDAPLDDTNIGRFGDLVVSMSKDVQFILITHNKITMEKTRHLLGVTMQESGVSRLVSVDMDAAIEMAAMA